MPDWCFNKITAVGPRDELERYRAATFSPDQEDPALDHRAVDFGKVVPERDPSRTSSLWSSMVATFD